MPATRNISAGGIRACALREADNALRAEEALRHFEGQRGSLNASCKVATRQRQVAGRFRFLGPLLIYGLKRQLPVLRGLRLRRTLAAHPTTYCRRGASHAALPAGEAIHSRHR